MEDVILYLIRHYPIHKVKEKLNLNVEYIMIIMLFILGNKQHVNIIKN
jgi:hypothetical protein